MKRKLFALICIIGILYGEKTVAQGFTELPGTLLPIAGNSKLCAGDLNNDGLTDLLVAGKDNTKSFAKVLQNNGDSTFFDLGLGLPALEEYATSLCDLNNDDWPDILIAGVNALNEPKFFIYINQKNGTFNAISHNIPGLRYSHIECRDLNLDGYADIFVMGLSDSGNYTAIFKNNKNLTFEKTSQSFSGVYDGASLLSDLNNDGLPDIFYTGLNTSFVEKSYLFINDGDFGFTERTSDIPGIRSGGTEAADINNDGYTDIAVFGNDENGNTILKVYQNNIGSSFTLHSDLQGIANGSVKFGDFNADGYPDLLTTGKDQSGNFTSTLYNNNSGLNFTDNGISLTGLDKSSCQWIDFNNDHKLDFVIAGYKLTGPTIELHSNNELLANQPPNAPLNLISETNSHQLSLKWGNATDNEQAGKGLTYNVWIKNDETGEYLFTPLANTSNGKRKLVEQGNFEDTAYIINNMPEGKYYWSVQAVDAAFEGSDFAPSGLFYITYPFDLGNDTTICYNNTISFSLLNVEGSFKWYHSANPASPVSTTKELNIGITQKDTIWVEVTKSFGSVVRDSIVVDIYALPIVNLGSNRSICYGDNINLNMGTASDTVNWGTLSGTYTETNKTNFNKAFYIDDKVFVKLTDNKGCTNKDTVDITVKPLPEINLVNDTSICKYSTFQLNLGTVNDSINWYSLTNFSQTLNSNTFEYEVLQNNTIKIEWYGQNRCVNYDTIHITPHNLPIANAGDDKLICEGYSTVIGPETANPGWTYLWQGNGILSGGNTSNPTIQANTESKYYLTVNDEYSCVGIDSMFVKMNPVGNLNAGDPQAICIGNVVTLGGSPTAEGSILPYSYNWSPVNTLSNPLSANPIANPTETTTYSLIIFTGSCPVDTLQTTVTVNPLPVIEIMGDTIAGFQENITLQVSGGVNYVWSPSEYLDNHLSQNPVANLEKTSHFTVEVSDANTCTDTAGVTIFIKNEIFIPELFTPNDDGNNDFFKVYGFGIKELQLLVFNKYGNIVYESSIIEEILNTGWDGKDKGSLVEEGKYFWKITGEFYSGEKVLFKGKDSGIVTILR